MLKETAPEVIGRRFASWVSKSSRGRTMDEIVEKGRTGKILEEHDK
jgi:hypothetical protein